MPGVITTLVAVWVLYYIYSPGIQPNQVTVPLFLSLVMTVGDKKHVVFEYGKFDIKS